MRGFEQGRGRAFMVEGTTWAEAQKWESKCHTMRKLCMVKTGVGMGVCVLGGAGDGERDCGREDGEP